MPENAAIETEKQESKHLKEFREPVELLHSNEFISLFGMPSSSLGEGNSAEVGPSKDPDTVIKMYPATNAAVSLGIAEAISVSRIFLQQQIAKKPEALKKYGGKTPIAYGIWNGYRRGLAIAVPKRKGVGYDKCIRENSQTLPLRLFDQVERTITRTATEELARRIAQAHQKGIAINDVKLDGCLISQTGNTFYAHFIDFGNSMLIPDPLYLAEVSKTVDAKISPSPSGHKPMTGSEAGEYSKEVCRALGFVDARADRLLGAEELADTYLRRDIQEILSRQISESEFTWCSGTSKPKNFIKAWYGIFQETCDKDWEAFGKIVNGKAQEIQLPQTDYQKYLGLVEQRKKISKSISSDSNLGELNAKFYKLDKQIYDAVGYTLQS